MTLAFFRTSPIVGLLAEIVRLLKEIRMDTNSLNSAVAEFSTDFSKFALDLTTFLQSTATPQNQADVDKAVKALQDFDAQVKTLDAAVNPPAAPAA